MKADKARTSKLSRKTKETEIAITLSIDGSGKSDVRVPDDFLRHMLETVAKYALFDLKVNAKGDINHHLVEDVAITLGKSLREAIGDAPICRVAYAVVPMDEALVSVAVDLIDRPYVNVEVPDMMYEHFLRSFAMEAKATLHSQILRGKDQHHVIEATFKALGLSLKDATRRSGSVMSTKSSVQWKRN